MKVYFVQLFERIVFMGVLFGMLWALFIFGDSGSGSSLLSRAHYYFWMVLPLVVFGILYHACAVYVRSRREGASSAETSD
jgi:hypothetical protein